MINQSNIPIVICQSDIDKNGHITYNEDMNSDNDKIEAIKKHGRYTSMLESAGLNENEAQVYEIILNNGQLGIAKIDALTPEIKRTNLYSVLYSLRDKGFIEQTIREGKINFKPCDPHSIRDMIEEERRKLTESSMAIEAYLPGLLSIYNYSTNRPSVRSYEGTEGLKLVYLELNSSEAKEILLFRSVYDDDHPEIANIVQSQIKKQVELGIKTKALTPIVPESKMTYEKLDRERLVERRIVEREKMTLPAQVIIFKNTVVLIAMKNKIIETVIENQDIAATFRVLFKYLWESSKKYHDRVRKDWGEE